MVTQVEIARKLGLDVSSVNKILNRKPGPVFNPATIRRVFAVAEKLGFDFTRLDYTRHCRRAARSPVEIPIELELRRRQWGVARGKGAIRDLSTIGARLADLRIEPDAIPTSQFSVVLTPLGGILQHLELRGRTVRMAFEEERLQIGIEFIGLDAGMKELLERAARRRR